MSASNPPTPEEAVLGVPADDFHEFVDKAITDCGEACSSSANSRPLFTVEVTDFEEYSSDAVTSPDELRGLVRPQSP